MGEYKDRHLEIEDEQGRPTLVCTCGDTIPIHWKFLVVPHYYISCVCGQVFRKVNEWVGADDPYVK